MKSFAEFYQELKENELHTDHNLNVVKHYNNQALVDFLKKPENKGHKFIGLDKHGKPLSADMTKTDEK